MAYVYAHIDALDDFSQKISQHLPLLEILPSCKDDLIAETLVKIRQALGIAEDAERTTYLSLLSATDALRDAEARTAEYNSHLSEGEMPMSTPSFYYEAVDEREADHNYAVAIRQQAENTLIAFEEYVKDYRASQAESLEIIKKLLNKSDVFFQDYTKLLIEAKKCTVLSECDSVTSSTDEVATPDSPFGRNVDASDVLSCSPGCYHYLCDESNAKRAYGQLTLVPKSERVRDSNAQRVAGGPHRRDDDDGGHLIAVKFGGSPSGENLIPQNKSLNRGEYKHLEYIWEKELKKGNQVFVNIYASSGTSGSREDSVYGTYMIIDKTGQQHIYAFGFTNESPKTQDAWDQY